MSKSMSNETRAVADDMMAGYLPEDDVIEREKAMAKGETRTPVKRAASTTVDEKVQVAAMTKMRWAMLDLLEGHGFVIKSGTDSLAFSQELSILVGKHFQAVKED